MKVDPIFFALSIIIGLAISYFLGFYVTGRILFMVSPVGRVFTRFEIEVYWGGVADENGTIKLWRVR